MRRIAVVRRLRPVHISIVGGEPLVRYRELGELLPRLDRMGVEVQLVTSAVRPIPQEWKSIRCLHLVVSIDGLAPEHDQRRTPATYDRILKHIDGHRITVHCTVTRQMLARPGLPGRFLPVLVGPARGHKIWFSIYTPQEGDDSHGTPAARGPRNPFRRSCPPWLRGFRRCICRGWYWMAIAIRRAHPRSVRSPS